MKLGWLSRLCFENLVTQPHWHIDYIRSEMKLVEVWFQYGQKSRECERAKCLAAMRAGIGADGGIRVFRLRL
jgi:Uri superfamily endonuclease